MTHKRIALAAALAGCLSAATYSLAQSAPAPSQAPAFGPAAENAAQPAESKAAKEGEKTLQAPEGGNPAGETRTPTPTPKPGGMFDGNWIIFVMLGGIILLYVWMGRGRRKQESKRKEMLAALKKGDKVTSIGGVIGTVIEVRDDEVTVKVDETNNVRMRFARWAIRGVGEAGRAEGTQQDGDKK